ncbi:MAG: hypothetical protein EKK61_00900 [Rickettsiales bacterium]|nr:MAG: hypothetical protein EKK61_00900 [Rickettsiales bacterium]
MTKTLTTLIKLNKNKLDKILKEVELREIEKKRLFDKKNMMQNELNAEIEKFSSTEFSFMLEKYVEKSNKMIKTLDAQMMQQERIIDALRQTIKEQFAELKKFEIAYNNRKIIENDKDKKANDKIMDENNINKFFYNKNSDL